jgi:UDP-glucose 4-epimerase
MTRILVTGASGFIGAALVRALAERGKIVRAAYRKPPALPDHVETVAVGDLSADLDWARALADVSAVVHLAGPAHARASEAELRRAVIEGTGALAEQAENAGVARFVFMSSIKAAAARTHGRALSEAEAPNPEDAYGRAKLQAETLVLARSSLNPIVLRPPLVHAPEAKGNFAALLRLADTPAPLPFRGVDNRRSLISLASLIEAVIAVLEKPDGPSGLFHVADQPSVSTPALIAALRTGMGRRERLFRAPGVRYFAPAVLTDSLEVDDGAFRAAYGYGARSGELGQSALVSCGWAWKLER